MPLSTGGLNSGLKWIITPGAGKRNSLAWAVGTGPNVLTPKAKSIPKQATLLISKFHRIARVYTIYILPASFAGLCIGE